MISLAKIAALVVVSVLFSGSVKGDPNTSVDKEICTERHYGDRGGYDICVYYVTNELVAMTDKRGYSYSVDGRSHDEFTGQCYGHAACSGNLSPDDCTWCLNDALLELQDYCSTSVGAQVKLADCRIRYEITRSILTISSFGSCVRSFHDTKSTCSIMHCAHCHPFTFLYFKKKLGGNQSIS